MAGGEETNRILQKNLIETEEPQTKYAGGKKMNFVVGDNLWLSTRNLKTSRLKKS